MLKEHRKLSYLAVKIFFVFCSTEIYWSISHFEWMFYGHGFEQHALVIWRILAHWVIQISQLLMLFMIQYQKKLFFLFSIDMLPWRMSSTLKWVLPFVLCPYLRSWNKGCWIPFQGLGTYWALCPIFLTWLIFTQLSWKPHFGQQRPSVTS